jgi:hypothetical protein
MRATSSPAASRWRMTAMTWRLAVAFWASTQLGSEARLARIWTRVVPQNEQRPAWSITGSRFRGLVGAGG